MKTPPRALAWLMRRFTRENPDDLWHALRLGPQRGGVAFFRGAYVLGALVITTYAAATLVLLNSIPRAAGNVIYHPIQVIALLLLGGMGSLQVMTDVKGSSRARRMSVVAVWLGVLLVVGAVLVFDW